MAIQSPASARARSAAAALCAGCLFASSTLRAQSTQPASTPATQSSTNPFSTFGISLTPPPDAAFGLSASPSDIAFYQFLPSSPYNGAAILIEVTPVKQPLADVAKSIATKAKATVDPKSFTVAGEPAAKLIAEFTLQNYTTRTSYLVMHESRLYMISALTAPGINADKPLEDLLKSITFIKPDSPRDHFAELFDAPIAIFGRFSMDAPRSMRSLDIGSGRLTFSINDYSPGAGGPWGSGGAAVNLFNTDLQQFSLPNPRPFATFRDDVSAGIQKQLSITDPVRWQTSPTVPGLNFTQPLLVVVKPTLEAAVTTKEQKFYYRFAVLQLGGADLVQIRFMYLGDDDRDTKAYQDLSDKMLASIKIFPPNRLGLRPGDFSRKMIWSNP